LNDEYRENLRARMMELRAMLPTSTSFMMQTTPYIGQKNTFYNHYLKHFFEWNTIVREIARELNVELWDFDAAVHGGINNTIRHVNNKRGTHPGDIHLAPAWN
jgi:hypothetical protein